MDNYGVRLTLNGYRTVDVGNTYEDEYVVACNENLNEKKISMRYYKYLMKQWFRQMSKFKVPWGFKDPQLFTGLLWVIDHFNGNLTIIRTKRRAELVVRSMVEKIAYTTEQAVQVINGYEKHFQKVLKGIPVIEVYFDGTRKTENDFVESFNKSLAIRMAA